VSWTLVLGEAKPPKGGTFYVCCAVPLPKGRKPIFVTANVRAAHKDAVAAISSGGKLILTGRLIDVRFGASTYRTRGSLGLYVTPLPDQDLAQVVIHLDDCTVGDAERVRPVASPIDPATAPVDPEAEARKQLNLAENYRRAGLASKALDILRSVVKDYPNTVAAKKAQEQIKQLLQDEAKKTSKGS